MNDSVLPCSKVPIDALPVNLDYITEELKVRAKTELFEDEKTRVQSLKLLRSMLEKEEGLRWQDDDLFLLAFLRVKKFDVKRAFNHIKGFYYNFGKHGDIYYSLNFDRLKTVMEQNAFSIFPYRDSEGCVIIMFRCLFVQEVCSSVEVLFSSALGLIEALRSPSTQIAGFQLIADFKEFSPKLAIYTTPTVVGFFADMVQNAIPVRMRGMHVVNQNHFFSFVWPLVKIFLSKKLRERIHIHGNDMNSLHKFFHPSILPADLGGELPPFNNADWQARMEASADYIKHVLSFGYENCLKKHCRENSTGSDR